MTIYKSAGRRLDLEALRRAIELCDSDTMLSFYAEDARVRVLNGDTPQSPPFELRGKAEIAGYLRAICDGDATRWVGNGLSSEERIAFSETCEYPDGTRIVVHTTLELREGEIVRQVDVVVREAREEAGEGRVRGNRKEEEAVERQAFNEEETRDPASRSRYGRKENER